MDKSTFNKFYQEFVRAVSSAANGSEEDLKIQCEHVFLNYLPELGIEYDKVRYEFYNSKAGRMDSLFGHVIFEYKKPGRLLSDKEFSKAETQTQNYIEAEGHRLGKDKSSFVGIFFDGSYIGFVRWVADGWRPARKQPFTEGTFTLMLQYLHSLSRFPLDPTILTHLLGPNSKIAKECLSALWKAFENHSQRTEMLFKEWNRLFGQVTGFEHGQNRDLIEFAKNHGVSNINHIDKFIFVMHTYYALLIKLLAAELLTYYRQGIGSSYIDKLITLSAEQLKNEFDYLENGGVFRDNFIDNFLEGDFFCWYTGEWNEELNSALRGLAQEIAKFEPATSILDPTRIEDLLKKLYQNMVPPSVRHDLGEFYTPDWLAEYVLQKVGFNGKDKRRVLDPTCGSGTFLMRALKKLISEARETDSPEILPIILKQVVGFDLNPLAVIAARTNYLIALGDLINQTDKPIELPIYLSDSIFAPSAVDNGEEVNYVYKIITDQSDINISIPNEIVQSGKLGIVLGAVEYTVITYTNDRNNAALYLKNILDNEDLSGDFLEQLLTIYDQIAYLQSQNWNRIWCRIIKNYYASAYVGKFDLIVGNPPWLRWTRLPEGYRETIKDYCRKYNLFSKDKWVGGIETDISTVILYSACERWLADDGLLGFLITRTVFKSESSEGFRNFKLPNDEAFLEVCEVEDLTEIKPFEGVSNKTSLILLKKGDKPTSYPLKYTVWSKVKAGQISDTLSLEDVESKVNKQEIVAYPIYEGGGPWLTVPKDNLSICLSMIGQSPYKGRKGVCADLNGVYWLDKIQPQGKMNIKISNNPSLGRNNQVPVVNDIIEKDLVYPLARGRDIKPFKFYYSGMCIILPQDSMDGYPIEYLMNNYPNTLKYLMRFEKEDLKLLSERSSYRRFLSRRKAPFYSVWNVGKGYTFAKYKVAWSEISQGLVSAVLSSINHPVLGEKIVIPDHKIYFAYTDNEQEAHYLCACLNSGLVRSFVKGYVEGTQIAAHILEYINIPGFDENNAYHLRLANLSINLHNSTKVPSVKDLREIDSLVMELF